MSLHDLCTHKNNKLFINSCQLFIWSSVTCTTIPSILKIHLLRVWPQSLFEYPGVVALLEHVQVDPSLVLEPNPLCVGVSVERVHQDEWHVATMLLVHVLQINNNAL